MAGNFRSISVNAGDKSFRSLLAVAMIFVIGIVVGSLSAAADGSAFALLFGPDYFTYNGAGLLNCISKSIGCNLPLVLICFIGALTVFGLPIPLLAVVGKGAVCGYITAVLYINGRFGYYFVAVLLPQLISSIIFITIAIYTTRHSLSLSRLAIGNHSEYKIKSVLRHLLVFTVLTILCCVVDGLLTWLFHLIF